MWIRCRWQHDYLNIPIKNTIYSVCFEVAYIFQKIPQTFKSHALQFGRQMTSHILTKKKTLAINASNLSGGVHVRSSPVNLKDTFTGNFRIKTVVYATNETIIRYVHNRSYEEWYREFDTNLTHWSCDKMAAIWQTTFSNPFSCMEIVFLWFVFSISSHHRSRSKLGVEQPTKPLFECTYVSLSLVELTHLPLENMAAISQTTFSNAFSYMKNVLFWFEFHWSVFLRV